MYKEGNLEEEKALGNLNIGNTLIKKKMTKASLYQSN